MPKALKRCGEGQMHEILSGDRLRLISGETVALAEIKAPEFWPDGSPYKSWPYAAQAKAALRAATTGKTLSLFCASKRQNHQGDIVAHVRLGAAKDGSWLQHTLVQNGHAYFMPHSHRSKAADDLRTAEATARQDKKGLWAYDALSVVRADSKDLRPGWFQIIRGKVLSEKRLKGRTYLNFGDDWRKDFTVEIPKRLYRQFGAGERATADQSATRFEPVQLGFEGRQIEVRGWVEWAGGPKIIIEHAAQLSLVPDPDAQSR